MIPDATFAGNTTTDVTVTQVDAFTDRIFEGNPAAVCLLPTPRTEVWMQQMAREMNLSETAFLEPQSTAVFGLRWFTPTVEVDLCGHATLASAHVLWDQRIVPEEAMIRFSTRAGVLTAQPRDGAIELDFPAVVDTPATPPVGLLDALGVEPRYVGRNRFDYLVEIESEARVRALRPDLYRLGRLEARGVIVTARSSDPAFDFVSRFFAPAAGVDEDPVTGSAHCCLGPYWSRVTGKDSFTAYQASPRGGVVRLRVEGERVKLSGHAVTVFSAQLRG